ncbi:MAG TPA: protease pro-enzyme activation domain-containing protein, partial [Spirochaetia bacterium]|nr:protease pro-enzyme activation domain-containing protein [Spirochaetia bacterium]
MATRQDRVELKGSLRAVMPGGRDAGPADGNEQIEVSVLVRRGSKTGTFPAVAELGKKLPRDRTYLSREEFARLHGATEADLKEVRAFAGEYGLRVVS